MGTGGGGRQWGGEAMDAALSTPGDDISTMIGDTRADF
jgi:hypothetical protein